MRATVIINPVAGPGRARTLDACASLARAILQARGFETDVRVTRAPDDAQRQAEEAVRTQADLVVAWGGDGTINGVGAALAGTGVPLGIVPAGSGNGLARDLRLPADPAAALAVAGTGATRAIDAGELHGSLFFNVAGIGLDARIADRLASPGARRGLLGYVMATLSELPRYQPRTYSIDVGRAEPSLGSARDRSGPAVTGRGEPSGSPETLHEKAIFIALANSRQYGAGAQIAPQARLDDGQLELVVVQPQSLLRIVSQIPAFFRGTLHEGPAILMRGAAEFRITSDHPIPFHVDGEPRAGAETLLVRTRSGVLLVRVGC